MYSAQRRFLSQSAPGKKRPSRLVLSTQVANAARKQRKPTDLTRTDLNRREPNLSPRLIAQHQEKGKHWIKRENENQTTYKHMKMSQSLLGVSRMARSSSLQKIQSHASFDDFELLPAVKDAIKTEALKGLEIVNPTPVQKLVFSTLLGNSDLIGSKSANGFQSFLIAAETGSGKTLAYTIPILDYLKREEREQSATKLPAPEVAASSNLQIPGVHEDHDHNGKPRAVILVPTLELVTQVGLLLKSLSHVVKFRSALLSREISPTVIRNRLFKTPVDIVVCTPHLLDSLTKSNPKILSDCRYMVVDEADSLFDRSFSPITSAIISRATAIKCLVLCSATIPKSLDTRLRSLYPNITRLVTPNLHVIPRRIQLSVVDIDGDLYKGNRLLACADVLYTIAKENTEPGYMKQVIIFVNERKQTEEVASYLRSKNIDCVALNRDISDRTDSKVLSNFTGNKIDVETNQSGRQRMKVLVTTDISSRGVDTKTIKNVILFDVPHSSIDVIHRIGRIGRMGRRGKATILIDKHTNKGWIKDLRTSMHMGGPLI
ncbi:P-loop containing nucleoside triphosphate hydrolase protein [Geopyxis carbonaria]|nr:P-loop containing nucleoside triphosphate hydrolase protein [Geopyxis carbonaria]